MARDKVTKDWLFIDDADADKLIEALRPAHWKLPVRMLKLYGMRASEVLSITPANIRNGCLVLQRLKRGKLTRQVLHPSIKDEVLALAATRTQHSRLFPRNRRALWAAIHHAALRAGIDEAVGHPHAFRHACGRRWARKVSINTVGAMMGHRSLRSTMMYADLSCDEELSREVFGLKD